MPLTLNKIKKKPAAFFQGRKAELLFKHTNLAEETISKGEIVTIIKKSVAGLMLDIRSDTGVQIDNVWFECLELEMSSPVLKMDDLRGLKHVKVYIPALNHFYTMQVERWEEDGKPAFSISNTCMRKNFRIQGHEKCWYIFNQDHLDKFFYLEAGEVTDQSFINAEAKFQLNGRGWIFSDDKFMVKNIDLPEDGNPV